MELKQAYKHAEAFKLMRYASDDAIHQELLWNSRDGVTPFMIHDVTGQFELQHVAWRSDVRIERFLPPIGSRLFVDMSAARVRHISEEWCEHHWESVLKKYFTSRSAAIESHIESFHEGEPDIITVDSAYLGILVKSYAGAGYVEVRRPWEIYQFHSKPRMRFA